MLFLNPPFAPLWLYSTLPDRTNCRSDTVWHTLRSSPSPGSLPQSVDRNAPGNTLLLNPCRPALSYLIWQPPRPPHLGSIHPGEEEVQPP